MTKKEKTDDHILAPFSREAGRKTFSVSALTIILIQTFGIWQMGVMYYSAGALTVLGLTPLPFPAGNLTLFVLLGYVSGSLVSFFLPDVIGTAARVCTVFSFLCVILLFMPFAPEILCALYCAEAFSCVAFIGIIGTVIIDLYSLKTALKDGVIAAVISSPFIALLHSGLFKLDFTAFNAISAAVQISVFIGLQKIPARAKIAFLPSQRSLPTEKRVPVPKKLYALTAFVVTIACFCMLFSATAAESLKNGVLLLYSASFFWALLFAFLYFKLKINPFRLFSVYCAASAFGFVLWLMPADFLMPVSIFMQGVNIVVCNLTWFLAGVLFERSSSKIIAPMCNLNAMLTVAVHSVLLKLLRDSAELLYALYAGIALLLLIGYLASEPYLMHVWLSSSDRDKAGESEPPKSESGEGLTRREAEVTELAVKGYTNADIAKMLYISEYTVKDHIKSIYRKTNVHSRRELALKLNKDKGAQ